MGPRGTNNSGRRAPAMLNKMFKESFDMEKTMKKRNISFMKPRKSTEANLGGKLNSQVLQNLKKKNRVAGLENVDVSSLERTESMKATNSFSINSRVQMSILD